MPKTPPYSLEFRREAVRLPKSSGRPVSQLARELGCSPQSLRIWSRQLDVDDGRAAGVTSDEREELRRLRRSRTRSVSAVGVRGARRVRGGAEAASATDWVRTRSGF